MVSYQLAEFEWEWMRHTCCDSETSHEIVKDGPDCRFCLDFGGKASVCSQERNSGENNDMQPVQMFVPVGECPRLVDNMQFLLATSKN